MATIIKHRFEFEPNTLREYIDQNHDDEFCTKYLSMTGCTNLLVEVGYNQQGLRDKLFVYLPDTYPVQPLISRLPNCHHTENIAGTVSIQSYRSASNVKALMGVMLPWY